MSVATQRAFLRLVSAKTLEPWAKKLIDDLTVFLHEHAVEINNLTAGGASVAEPFVTMALSGALTNERVLAGTAGEIQVADGGANGNAALALIATGVVAATYGSSTTIPVIAVDAKGRITAASSAAVGATVGRPTYQDLTGATGTGPHALSGTPSVAIVSVAGQPLRLVGGAPTETTQYALAGPNITLGVSLVATDHFLVWWWP